MHNVQSTYSTLSTPSVHPQMYRVAAPNKNPILELVLCLLVEDEFSHESTVVRGKDARAAAKKPTWSNECLAAGEVPVVTVSSKGDFVRVDPGHGFGRPIDLTLPQRVVPDSATSFFWEGNLTVRASFEV